MSCKKYTAVPISKKIEAIREVELGEKSKTQIAKEYNVPPSTLSTWLKNKDVLLKTSTAVGEKRKREKILKYPYKEYKEKRL